MEAGEEWSDRCNGSLRQMLRLCCLGRNTTIFFVARTNGKQIGEECNYFNNPRATFSTRFSVRELRQNLPILNTSEQDWSMDSNQELYACLSFSFFLFPRCLAQTKLWKQNTHSWSSWSDVYTMQHQYQSSSEFHSARETLDNFPHGHPDNIVQFCVGQSLIVWCGMIFWDVSVSAAEHFAGGGKSVIGIVSVAIIMKALTQVMKFSFHLEWWFIQPHDSLTLDMRGK